MMQTVAVIVSKHSPVITAAKQVIDESEIVTNDLTLLILPNLFAKNSSARRASYGRTRIHDLEQAGSRCHLLPAYHRWVA